MVFKAHKGLRGFLFPSPPHLISLSGTCCKLMRLRIQQNNCVKEQICSFCFIKTKRQRGRAGSRFRDGKANENLVPADPPDHIFAAMQTSSLFLPSRDTQAAPLPCCTWNGNRNILICAQLEKTLQTSRAVIHHGCGTHSSTHKPAKPPQDKWSQQQLTQNARHQSLCTDKQLVKELLQELRDVDL